MSTSSPPGRLAWPWPADTPLERARRLLLSYRAALAALDRTEADRLDQWALDRGQGWVIGAHWNYDKNDLLTLGEVADLAHVKLTTVYAWHQRGLPYTSTVDGPRVNIGDLMRWEQQRRQRRAARITP